MCVLYTSVIHLCVHLYIHLYVYLHIFNSHIFFFHSVNCRTLRLFPYHQPQPAPRDSPLKPKSRRPDPTQVSQAVVSASGSDDLCVSHSAFWFSDLLVHFSWCLGDTSNLADLSVS